MRFDDKRSAGITSVPAELTAPYVVPATPTISTGRPYDIVGNTHEMHRTDYIGAQSGRRRARAAKFERGSEKPQRSRIQRGTSTDPRVFNAQTGHRIMPVSLFLRGFRR